MISDIEEYFSNGCGRCERFATPDCSTRRWSSGIAKLRQICLGMDLVETIKWGHPCYMHGNRNIVIFGALRNDFRLSFFNAALMKYLDGILEKQGPNTQHADMIRFTKNSQVAKMKPIIVSYLAEAMSYAEAGLKPPKQQGELELPDELIEALESDPELAEAFHGLTPGRKKSYVINLNSAKKSETRISRISKFRAKFLQEKARWNAKETLFWALFAERHDSNSISLEPLGESRVMRAARGSVTTHLWWRSARNLLFCS